MSDETLASQIKTAMAAMMSGIKDSEADATVVVVPVIVINSGQVRIERELEIDK